MAEKAASIKVNLKGDQAKSEIRGLKDDTKRAAGEMGSALQGALSTGLKGGTDALKGAFSSIKSVVMSIGGLVGGLGIDLRATSDGQTLTWLLDAEND